MLLFTSNTLLIVLVFISISLKRKNLPDVFTFCSDTGKKTAGKAGGSRCSSADLLRPGQTGLILWTFLRMCTPEGQHSIDILETHCGCTDMYNKNRGLLIKMMLKLDLTGWRRAYRGKLSGQDSMQDSGAAILQIAGFIAHTKQSGKFNRLWNSSDKHALWRENSD